jgi:hypothetical protein
VEHVPYSFIVYRDIFVLTYATHLEYVRLENKGKDNESLVRINPLLWHIDSTTQTGEAPAVGSSSLGAEGFQPHAMAMPVFDESIMAFVISKDDTSFYMDLKGVYDREFNKIHWSDRVVRVAVVRPYLIGFLQSQSIEIKCIFNPNRVIQKVELLQAQMLRYSVAVNSRELDSMYVLLNRKHTGIRVLLKLTQIDPRLQVNMLIERKLYSTGLKICDFLLENNNFEGASMGLSKEQYVKLQKEKGFYNFIVKRRYAIAKEIFKEYKVPLSHVIMLFAAELYPEPFIKAMIHKFDVKVQDIPYHELLMLNKPSSSAESLH